jgi:low temperature requirement protein LtrA
MRPRSPDEAHRAATPLELFFDLVFVVAIAQAASGLHHGIAEAHTAAAVLGYTMVFFAIWWAWMNFTWFASAYDPDDVAYRLVVFVQLTGALIFAAGLPRAFAAQDWRIGAFGYVVMRLALVAQWLRAARADPGRAPGARRYAIGVTLIQVAWVWLALGEVAESWFLPLFVTFAAVELLVPVWAERRAATPWHPAHIAERYGLLTIIVLGESILAATLALDAATAETGLTPVLVEIIAGGLLIVFSMWWLYFYRPVEPLLKNAPLWRGFAWGYGHYFVYAAGAAVGAGIAVATDHATAHATIGGFGAQMAVAAPVALYLVVLWVLHELQHPEVPTRAGGPLAAGLILATPLVGHAVLLTGLILALLLAAKLVRREGASFAPQVTGSPSRF